MCRLCLRLPLWVSHVSPLPVFSPFGLCVFSRIAAILAQAFGHLILEAGALRAPCLCSIFAILFGFGHGTYKVVTEEAWDCSFILQHCCAYTQNKSVVHYKL